MLMLRLSRAAVADATVLLATGLSILGARILLKFARAGDNHLVTDYGGDEE